MHLLDWLIVAIPLAVVAGFALSARKYLRSVADFMAGGRVAGRYLLCTAKSEMGAGAVAYVALFEAFYNGGFSLSWWQQLQTPAFMIVAISGFVVYRFRQTRALTLAQFFEMRYSRNFRLFTGVLGVFAGLVNFGIIPIIGARYIVYLLGLNRTVHIGPFEVETCLLFMALFLSICVAICTMGGQITVMIADCIQGMFSQVFYVVIAIALLALFKWANTRGMLLDRPAGNSIVNPFHASNNDFNLWYVVMVIFIGTYGTMAWQNQHAFNSSAASPHEGRMGNILGRWRGFALQTTMVLLAVCAMTYLHSPAGNASAEYILQRIPAIHAKEKGQMQLVVALSQMLPIGIKGMLVAVGIMGIFGGDSMHIHSWSSIIIQDIVLPLRKKPLTTTEHLKLLRLSVVGVAIFVFFFGALFRQTEYVAFWFQVTMAIYVGGAGACIIGGLYWSRGTTAGAWTALIAGSVLSTGGILIHHYNPNFPLSVVTMGFLGGVVALISYFFVSILTCRQPHNMDKLLHRGPYAVEPEAEGEGVAVAPTPQPKERGFKLRQVIGIDQHFSRTDRWAAYGIFFWCVFWLAVCAVGSAIYVIHPWSDMAWANYWLVAGIYLPLLMAIATTIWFTIGCWHDVRIFFRRLATERVDVRDDGTVRHDDATRDASPVVPVRPIGEKNEAALVSK
jgi:SSS family solute:Na+ symporter